MLMTGKQFVDTNILVYAHDANAKRKHEIARDLIGALWESGSGVISTQVLQEFYVNVVRKTARPLKPKEAQRFISSYLHWDVVVNSGDSIVQAFDIESRYRISFWDALVIQAANSAGAEILYSEDLSHGQNYDGVKVVNPFRDVLDG
jgi:predicted nucleic acid-binding protein